MRASGILMHITSLPSAYGIGCMDRAAYQFVDFLAQAGQRFWQVLPLGATGHEGAWDSPYQAFSAFAGNPYLISLEALIDEGVLTRKECAAARLCTSAGRVDYEALSKRRLPLLRKAYERSGIYLQEDYRSFLRDNAWWLDDYALFMALRSHFGGRPFRLWPEPVRLRAPEALDEYRRRLYFDIEFHCYLQYQFYHQWTKLKAYANEKHIRIIGDLPIYVSPDSADVWAHPELFALDEAGEMTHIAGCPPDDFSADGQVWGNPLYDWDHHRRTGYSWWVSRMWHSYRLYDLVRLDHFRGFDEYFAIPASTMRAADGHWQQGPGMELFDTLTQHLGPQHIIAEDLGLQTDGVRALVSNSGYPNMKVLQFAFDPDDAAGENVYLPHNYTPNCVVYTGTHDNAPTAGWCAELPERTRERIRSYLGRPELADDALADALVTLAVASTASICIVPLQDYLGLGSSARMNTPGTVGGNWSWRLTPGSLTEALCRQILRLTVRYGRANWPALGR